MADDAGASGQDGTPPVETPEGTITMTQDQLDKVIQDRLKRAEQKFKTQYKGDVSRLQEMEQKLRMSDEDRQTLQKEIEELEKRTLSADEIRKREEKKAQEKYQQDLENQKKTAETWQQRYFDSTINHEIAAAAHSHGLRQKNLPFLEAFLKPRTKLVEEINEHGEKTGKFTTQVDFQDTDSEGKPITIQLSVPETMKRMKELPDQYGDLFESDRSGGLGSTNGKSTSNTGYRPGMPMQEFMKLRKENPTLIYGE